MTRGFLSVPVLAGCCGGILATGRFVQDKFAGGLFDILGLPRPEGLGRAVEKRLAEFVAGRTMARIAQEAMGLVAQPVGMAEDRAPVWPPGLAGSISHTHSSCACLLLPEDQGRPGIDIEIIASGSDVALIEQIVLKGRDREHLRAGPLPFDVAATLCFSAKESLYKALYPTVRRYFGFEDAEVVRAPGLDSIAMRLTASLHATLPRGTLFDLSYEIDEGSVMTWMRHRGGPPAALFRQDTDRVRGPAA